MELKALKPISKMGAGFGETSEIIDVDTLSLEAIVVNHHTKSMILAFQWGGYDSTGKWHAVPPHVLPASHRSIQANVPGEKEIWDACCIDEKGNPVRNHDTAFVAKVLFEHGKLADIMNGGWAMKDVELQHEGVTVGAHDEAGVFKMSAKGK